MVVLFLVEFYSHMYFQYLQQPILLLYTDIFPGIEEQTEFLMQSTQNASISRLFLNIIKEERRAASPFLHLLLISFKTITKTNNKKRPQLSQTTEQTHYEYYFSLTKMSKEKWMGGLQFTLRSWQKLNESMFSKMIPWYSSTSYPKCKGELPSSAYISGIATGTNADMGVFYLR